MGHFAVFNVKGDGHCFYRCIWRAAREHPEIAEALLIEDLANEDEGCEEVRTYVALALNHYPTAMAVLENLIDLYKQAPSIVEYYPVLTHVDTGLCIDSNCERAGRAIDDTDMFASGLEIEIVRQALHDIDIDILVLSCGMGVVDKTDLADKWLRELHAWATRSQCTRALVLNNQDNLHYRYTKFQGSIVSPLCDVLRVLDPLMAESSESESEL